MNNRHSIALTGSSHPRSIRRLDIECTSTSLTLLEVDVLASLTLLSVQPRHASKESRRTRARIRTSQSFEPDNHYPLTVGNFFLHF